MEFSGLEERIRMQLKSHQIGSDQQAKNIIEDIVLKSVDGQGPSQCKSIINQLFRQMRCKLGVIQELLEDEHVNEIMVNSFDCIYIEKDGLLEKTALSFTSKDQLDDIIRTIAASVHREINELNPILDARLEDGSRVNAVYDNVALDGPVLTIRKFKREKLSMSELVSLGSVTQECSDYLRILVEAGYNVFLSGTTSSGKTTFLNALADFIPKSERVVLIEDSAELDLSRIGNLVRMECRNANGSGRGQVDMDSLIKTSLRMRPDRIIIGEVRGKEVSSMLQGLNTGHSGMSTGHGNSIKGMLKRMEAMYLMNGSLPVDSVRGQIAEAIDVMVQLVRFADGQRAVFAIDELVGWEHGEYILNPLFVTSWENNDRKLEYTGNQLQGREKLMVHKYGTSIH